MERRRVRFTGTVQGVGFRAATRAVAAGFEVTGWVRNEHDGSVLMEAQGDGRELEAFICSLAAKMDRFIESASADAVPPDEGERGFEIRG